MSTDLTEYGRDNHAISRDHYRINPAFLSEGVIRLGDGIDMSEPGAPQRRAGRSPLALQTPMRATGISDYTFDESFRFVETSSAREEAEVLSAYFQGSYKFVSADAAYKRAIEERSSSHSVYALIESTGETRDLDELLAGRPLVWKPDVTPALEGTAADPAEFRRQFLLDVGSHYVSAISYGYRLAIRGRVTTTDSSTTQNVRAAFKAAFLGGGAGGGVEDDARKALSRSDVELTFVATSGGLMHEDERRPGILTKLDDIIATLADLRSGAMTILGAPLSASVRTYWNLLPAEYALSRALLQDHGEPPPPEGFFGVPAGTIVMWHPTERAIYTDDTGERHLVPPTGWALCDGTSATPDLRDRFVRGTLEVGTIGSAAGSPTHTHKASTDKTAGTYESHAGAFATLQLAKKDHTHTVNVSAAAVDPPHVKLAFIMKL